MDRVLFGDNQFFGVNHMSEEKPRMQAMHFQDIRAVIKVLEDAYAEGIRTFMCTTHERIAEVCDHFRSHRGQYPDYKFYPCLPYAHKYANAAAELGVLGAIRSFLPQDNALGALLKGGLSLAGQACTGTSRVLVARQIRAEFTARLVAKVKALKIGSGVCFARSSNPSASFSPMRSRT